MKKLIIFFSLMFSALVFVSCGSDDEPDLKFDKKILSLAHGKLPKYKVHLNGGG